MESLQSKFDWPGDGNVHALDQFNLLRIGFLLCQDNRDLDPRTFPTLQSVADYINAKYDMNVKPGADTYRILHELDKKIKARAIPSLPTD